MTEILFSLRDKIRERMTASPEESYVAKMHQRGLTKIAQKVGEEATEVVIAALAENHEDLINESADLIFHLMLLLNEKNVMPEEVIAEITRRMGFSGVDEKKARKGN